MYIYIYNHIYILYPISKQATRFRPFMTLSVKPRPREFASTMGDSTPPGKSTKRYGNPWVFYESDLQSCWVSISISFYIYVNLQEGSGVRVYTGGIWSSRLFQTGVFKKRKHGNFNLQTPEVCPRTGPTFGQHSTNIIPKRWSNLLDPPNQEWIHEHMQVQPFAQGFPKPGLSGILENVARGSKALSAFDARILFKNWIHQDQWKPQKNKNTQCVWVVSP